MGKLDLCQLPNPPLPWWEITFYIGSWITVALYMGYSAFEVSRDYAEHKDVSYGLDDGWSFLGRQKDVTDSEWTFWRDSFYGTYGFWLCGQVLLGQLLQVPSLYPKRKYIFVVYSVLCYLGLVGFGQFMLIMIEMAIIFAIICFTASSALIWVVSLAFLLSLNVRSSHSFMTSLGLLVREPFYAYLFQEFTLAMTIMRLVSFGLFNCEYRRRIAKAKTAPEPTEKTEVPETNRAAENGSAERTDGDERCKVTEDMTKDMINASMRVKGEQKPDWDWERSAFSCSTAEQVIDLFCYVFYIPLIAAGPLMNYDVFYKQFHGRLEKWSLARLGPIVLNVFRWMAWSFVLEVLLHYLYSGPIVYKPSLLSVLPLWGVAGVGYMHSMCFVMKYMIIWGLCSTIAKFDRLYPSDVPSCGSRIYLYSEMWKNFDRGLYAFMKRHIYIMLGGSRHGLLRRMIALLACFGFIYLWHGLHRYILIWCFFNFSTIMLEMIADVIKSSSYFKDFEAKHFSPAMVRRLHSLVIVPVFTVSLFSIITFFTGLRSGRVFVSRLVFEGFPIVNIVLSVTLYFCIQTGKEVENYHARRQHSKVD